MRIAIFENIMTPGGNEIEFNRILVDELKNLGHEIFFYVPENFTFQFDYGVEVKKINGAAVSYTNSGGVKKIFTAAKREINRLRWYNQLYELQKNFDALIIPTATYRYLRALTYSHLKKISVPLIFFEKYKIGETFESGNLDALSSTLEYFINNFDKNFEYY